MENKGKKKYFPWRIEMVKFSEEDVIRTSYVDDNYGGWDDDNAKRPNDAGEF